MTAISDELMMRVSQYLARNLGWHFPPERWRDLERGINEIARTRHIETGEACIAWLLSADGSKDRIDALAGQFTVGETYFNRDLRSMDALEQHVLHELIGSRRGNNQRLRIWSAGCCTGEEPYSIAMLLIRTISDLDAWNITILGTDINPYFLEKARAGIYKEGSFRSSPAWIKDGYFRHGRDRGLEILPRLKRMVRLEQLNLVGEISPQVHTMVSGMDLILCRNVLMYFSPEGAAKVLDRFYHSLSNGGWLVVGEAEASLVPARSFATIQFPGTVMFRKLERNMQMSEQVRSEGFLRSELDSTRRSPDGPEWVSTKLPLTQEEECSLYEQGRYKDLEDALLDRASAASLGGDPRLMRLLAKVYASQGRYDEAFQWIGRAISADKLDAPSRYLQATILQEQSRIDDAIRALTGAIYLEPDFVIAHFSLGNLLLKQGRVKEGKRSLVTALALLSTCSRNDPLPESDGMSAPRLTEIITSIITRDVA